VKLQNKILMPVLGDQYGRMLSAGQIKIEQDDWHFHARYAEHRFPLSPESLSLLLSKAANRAMNDTLSLIADSFSRLPASRSRASPS
jgi:(1->4)-alpha-D-glucan 1-alpha-D-glucosylmutase